MASRGSRRSRRTERGVRRHKRIFHVFTEGECTEVQYFENMFNTGDYDVHVNVTHADKKTAPKQLLSRAIATVRKSDSNPALGDQVWLVIDRDSWDEVEISKVQEECRKKGWHLALSNPKIEYWILLHFEDGNNIRSSSNCDRRLLKYLPEYRKNRVEVEKLRPGLNKAVQRGLRRNQVRDWPRTTGSTVAHLVDEIINRGSALFVVPLDSIDRLFYIIEKHNIETIIDIFDSDAARPLHLIPERLKEAFDTSEVEYRLSLEILDNNSENCHWLVEQIQDGKRLAIIQSANTEKRQSLCKILTILETRTAIVITSIG